MITRSGQCPRCGKALWLDGTHTCSRPVHEKRTYSHREDGYRGRTYEDGESLDQGFKLLSLDGDD
jgi:hypothetical protein